MPLTPAHAGNPRPVLGDPQPPSSHLPAPISGPAAPPLLPPVGRRPRRSCSDGRESRPKPPPLLLYYPGTSVYSEVKTSRIAHALPLPSVLRSHYTLADGSASTAAGSPDQVAKLFPNLYGRRRLAVVPSAELAATKPLKIGVVLSGGNAPRGHNVICWPRRSRSRSALCFLVARLQGGTM